MLSQRARQGFEFIFKKTAKSTFVLNPDDACVVTPVTGIKVDQLPGGKVIILTVSSFLFRLMLILHIHEAPATRQYFANGAVSKDLVEVLSEIGNLCCGAMNRELLHHFSHLGMSTPYVLDSKCLAYLKELKPELLSSYEITINDTVPMHVSLCLCAYAPLDFAVDMSVAREETGELELF